MAFEPEFGSGFLVRSYPNDRIGSYVRGPFVSVGAVSETHIPLFLSATEVAF